MLKDAIKTIESCQSLHELWETWARNAEKWSELSGPEGMQLIETKNRKKSELMLGRWVMDSPIIGKVSLSFDAAEPDQVMVDGVAYSREEVEALQGADSAGLKQAHEVKKAFGGQVVTKGGD